MTCRFCGTALPEGALFCGECGRPVTSGAPAPRASGVGSVEFSSEPDAEPHPAAVVESSFLCPQCGEPISDDDVFCGECGFVLKVAPPPVAMRDTAALEPLLGEPAQDARDDEPVEPASGSEPGPALVEPAAGRPASPAAELAPVDDVDHEDDDPEPEAEDGGGSRRSVPSITPPKKSLRKVPDPFPWGQSTRAGGIDLEATRLTAPTSVEERFVLQFSTGESITVSGAGLVGRNPSSQPGEYVDQLVTIFDAGKSVSKTHLEFGQDSGRFWVSDRYSTNGSTVRQPDADPRRCEPGRRYFVARGTRVDIGDQFFVVS